MELSSTLIVDSSLERLVYISFENPVEKPVPTGRIVNGSGSSTVSGNHGPPRQTNSSNKGVWPKIKGGEEEKGFSYLFFSMSRQGPKGGSCSVDFRIHGILAQGSKSSRAVDCSALWADSSRNSPRSSLC